MTLQVGDHAPDFTMPTVSGDTVSVLPGAWHIRQLRWWLMRTSSSFFLPVRFSQVIMDSLSQNSNVVEP